MGYPGLTEQQSNFIDTFITVPFLIGRGQASEKRQEWAGEFKQINDQKDAVSQQVDAIADSNVRTALLEELARAEAALLQGNGKPDFDDASQRIELVARIAIIQPEHAACLDLINKAAAIVVTALELKPANGGEIQAALELAKGQARKGAKDRDMDSLAACKDTLKKLAALTDKAEQDHAAHLQALEILTGAGKALARERAEMGKSCGDPLPTPLATGADKITTALAKARDADTDTDTILATAGDAKVKIEALGTQAKALVRARSAWGTARQIYETLFATLSNHPRNGDATFVAPLVLALKTDFEAAHKKAEEQFDYAGATTDIAALPERCRKAISAADDVAEYEAVRADREKRVKAMPDAADVTEGAPRKKVQEVKKFYDDAVAEFQLGQSDKDLAHIATAVGLLNKVPEGQQAALELAKHAKVYEKAFAERKTEKTKFITWPDEYKNHLAAEITLFGTLVDAASLADDRAVRKASEYRAAAVKLDNLRDFSPTLYGKMRLMNVYFDEQKAFVERFTELDALTDENGRAAVVDYLGQIQSDELFADARFAAKDYASAIQAARNTAAGFEDVKKQAGIAKNYLTIKKTVEQDLVQVKADGGGNADDAAASIESMITEAGDEATAQHWQEALDLITKAQARTAAVEAISTAIHDINDKWDNVDTDAPDDAHAKFITLHDKIDGDDTDNILATPLAAEKQNADDAQAAAKTGGDAAVAATAIAAAMTAVYHLGVKLTHRAAYKTLYDTVKQAHEVELIKPEVNKDNIIDWYITYIGGLKTGAKTKADAPGYDFAEALKDLAEAERGIVRAEQISRDWIKLRPTLVKINDLAAMLDDPILDGNFATEKTRLEKYNTDITNEIQQGAFEKIRALIKEGGPFAEELEKVVHKYADLKNAIIAQIVPARAKITEAAAPHAKDARAQVAKHDLEITDLLKAHACDAAFKVASDLLNAVDQGVALNKLGVEYFALKTTCQDTLKDYSRKNSNDNTKVAERLEQLYEHFELASIFDKPGDLTTDVSTWEARQNFAGAIRRLKPIPAECAKLDGSILEFDTCKAQRDKTGEAVGKVLKKATGDIAPIAARLRGKHQNAVTLMNEGNYAVALKMFKELEDDAAKAAQNADLIAQLQGENADIGKEVDDDKLAGKVAAARGQVVKLRAMGNSAVADRELEAAEKAIAEAEAALGKDAGAVRDAVALAMREGMDAMQRIELFRQVDAAASYARAALVTLGEHTRKKFIEADIAEQNQKITAQMAKARDRSSTTDMVMNEIERVMAAVHDIRRIADNYQEFVDLKVKADADLVLLEKSETRYAVRDTIPAIRAHLAEADDQAQRREHLDALAALRRARTDQSAATLETKLEKGEVPSNDEIDAILKSPGGDKKLDRIIAGLDPKAQRGVLKAVMKVRFGCDVEVLKKSPESVDEDYRKWLISTNSKADAERLVELAKLTNDTGGEAKTQYDTWLSANAGKPDADKLAKLQEIIKDTRDPAGGRFDDWLADTNGKSDVEKSTEKTRLHADNVEDAMDQTGPNLLKLYNVMTDCPTSDTLDNDSMLVLSTSGGEQTGSSFASGIAIDAGSGDVVLTKKVVMREGDVDDSGFYGIALPFELDEIDDECKPVDADPLSHFSWNTLHEVGHAVDDKVGAMKGAGNAKAGWQEHGSNVLPIAKEAAKAVNYDYDENYIAAYLSGVSDPPIPAPPDPAKAEEWERKRRAVRVWVDMIRVSQKPWSSAAIAKASVLKNGRIYQESYGNDWTSYEFSERKKGVSGYQFRAPGEWFSELYAAYHSGKMNPSHPHREWIQSI